MLRRLGLEDDWIQFGANHTSDSTSTSYVDRVLTGADGSTYVSGHYYNRAEFGDISIETTEYSAGYVAKASPDGEWEWAVSIESDEDNIGSVYIALGLDGSVYAAGPCKGEMDYGMPSNYSTTSCSQWIGRHGVFVVKYDNYGEIEWHSFITGVHQGVGSENYYPVSAYMTDIASTSSGKVYLTGTIGSSSTGNEGSISQGGWANGYEIVTGSRDAFVFEVQNSSFDWIFGFESYDYNDYPEIRDLSVTTEGDDIVYNVAETNSGSGCVGASDDLIERCAIVRPSDGSSPSSTLIPLHENSMELAAGADGFFAADCKGPSKWVREYSVELTQLWEVNLSAYPENSTASGSCQLMPMDDGGVLVAIGDYTNGIYLVSIDENGTVAEVYSDILDCFGAGYSAEYPLACQITAGHMFNTTEERA